MTKRLFETWKEFCYLIQKCPLDYFFCQNSLCILLLDITFSLHLCGEGWWQFYFEPLLTEKKRLNPSDMASLNLMSEGIYHSGIACNKKASKQNSNPNLACSVSRFLARHITLVNLEIKCLQEFWETHACKVHESCNELCGKERQEFISGQLRLRLLAVNVTKL